MVLRLLTGEAGEQLLVLVGRDQSRQVGLRVNWAISPYSSPSAGRARISPTISSACLGPASGNVPAIVASGCTQVVGLGVAFATHERETEALELSG